MRTVSLLKTTGAFITLKGLSERNVYRITIIDIVMSIFMVFFYYYYVMCEGLSISERVICVRIKS